MIFYCYSRIGGEAMKDDNEKYFDVSENRNDGELYSNKYFKRVSGVIKKYNDDIDEFLS